MKYLHISQFVANGMKVGKGEIYNVGRNAAKRAARAGKPRKQWRSIGRA